jgi:hypothetical protein
VQDDTGKQRHLGFDLIPKPDGDALAGRILKAGQVIEQMMIELLDQGLYHPFEIGKIHDPAKMGIKWAIHIYPQTIGMPVDAPALVLLRYMRQKVGGVEGEVFEEFHESMDGKQSGYGPQAAAKIRKATTLSGPF